MLPEAEAGLAFYLAVQTQWRYSGMGVPTGLDYAGVDAYARLRGLTVTDDLFADLQVCEAAAMRAMSERAAKERKHG